MKTPNLKNLFLTACLFLTGLAMHAQFSCTDLYYDDDSVIVVNEEPFNGYCDYFEKGNVESRYYYSYGILDSVAFYYTNGFVQYMEPFVDGKIDGVMKRYNKQGQLLQTKTFRKGREEGIYREYDKRGKLRYEGDYNVDGELKNGIHYTWTKKGVKYKHSCYWVEKETHHGNIVSHSSRSKCKKTRVID